jgi:DNA-binding HxlR family transcriptional regulator
LHLALPGFSHIHASMDMRYGIFCPVAKAAEVVASRWTPLILSELMKGRERFIDIQQGVPLMSRSLLSRRLKEMEISNLIQRVPQGRSHVYRLTEAGNALRTLINQLAEWGSTWRLPYLDEEDRNVSYLMYSMRDFLLHGRLSELPAKCVVHFEFINVPRRDHKLRNWWLIKRDGDIDLCYTDMGFQVDLQITADLDVLTRIVIGTASLQKARIAGDVVFSENPRLVNKLINALDLVEPPQMRLLRVPEQPPPPTILPMPLNLRKSAKTTSRAA